MTARRLDIKIEQGANFKLNVGVNGITDLSGYTARMQVRPTVDSITKYVDETSSTSSITLVGTNVVINISSTITNAYTWDSGVWDLEIQSGSGEVSRLLQGYATLSKQVTR